jgi:hypothetical protein
MNGNCCIFPCLKYLLGNNSASFQEFPKGIKVSYRNSVLNYCAQLTEVYDAVRSLIFSLTLAILPSKTLRLIVLVFVIVKKRIN